MSSNQFLKNKTSLRKEEERKSITLYNWVILYIANCNKEKLTKIAKIQGENEKKNVPFNPLLNGVSPL